MREFKFSIVLSSLIFVLTGCVEQPRFYPTKLMNEARGVTIARSTPYNCVVLGEIEGRSDTSLGAIGANLQTLRDSAINDVKNNAIYATGRDKRIMLRIFYEKATCIYNGNIIDCTREEIGLVRSYRLSAQIFECGYK